MGKNAALNEAVRESHGEVLVFTDADAFLERDAVSKLLAHFGDPEVGGACGRVSIGEPLMALQPAQNNYARYEQAVRRLETRIGSTAFNEGKLYAMRRRLYRPVPDGASDDMFTCLSVVSRNHRMVFEPGAVAHIPAPSRSVVHELQRRRRIVSGSLTAIRTMMSLLNPRRYGFFSLSLFTTKILRRFVPVFMIILFVASLVLSADHPVIAFVFAGQLLFYFLAVSSLLVPRRAPGSIPASLQSSALYFCAGNFGTFLGLADFVRGRNVTMWTPLKGANTPGTEQDSGPPIRSSRP
jgi:biofilm PGA synthesis N-glycosyltransferase PgaC